MRPRVLFLITASLCLISLPLISQPGFWAQPGANWIYKIGDGTSFSSDGTVELTRAGDTLINGISCDILTVHYRYQENWPGGTFQDYFGNNIYTYQNADTVFLYLNNAFQILFNSNLQPGGYWITPGDSASLFCPPDSIFIDSIQTVNINGVMMKKLIPEIFDWSDPNHPTQFFHQPIYERFGSTLYFTPLPACIICPSLGPLLCYTDSSGFEYSEQSGNCPVGLPEIRNNDLLIQVEPNIASDEIRLNTSQNSDHKITIVGIYDATGNMISTVDLTGKSNYILNISNFAPGFYFIRPELKLKTKGAFFLKK